MSVIEIKSTLEASPIRWRIDFDDYDSEEYDDVDSWLEEELSAYSNLLERHPKAGFVVNFEAEEHSLVRAFYQEYLGDTEVGSARFTDALYVFAKLNQYYDNSLDEMFLALYYARNHDWDECSVMSFVDNDDSHSCVINKDADVELAAKEHLRSATSWGLAELLDSKGILVQAADSCNDGKMVIGPYTGYAYWPNQDEDY